MALDKRTNNSAIDLDTAGLTINYYKGTGTNDATPDAGGNIYFNLGIDANPVKFQIRCDKVVLITHLNEVEYDDPITVPTTGGRIDTWDTHFGGVQSFRIKTDQDTTHLEVTII